MDFLFERALPEIDFYIDSCGSGLWLFCTLRYISYIECVQFAGLAIVYFIPWSRVIQLSIEAMGALCWLRQALCLILFGRGQSSSEITVIADVSLAVLRGTVKTIVRRRIGRMRLCNEKLRVPKCDLGRQYNIHRALQ